jgi:hypothetical protein
LRALQGWGFFSQAEFALLHPLAQPSARFYFIPFESLSACLLPGFSASDDLARIVILSERSEPKDLSLPVLC